MSSPLPPTRRYAWILLTVVVSGVALWAMYDVFGDEFIESLYDRRAPISLLNNVIANTDGGGPDYYFDKGRLYFSRFLLVWIAAGVAVAAWVGRRQLVPALTDFFTAPSHPLNLALFRIAFFGILLGAAARSQATWYAALPRELLVPPASFGHWLCARPFNPEAVRLASAALMIVCITGMLGFLSRTSALLATILAFYVLGIPQCFGKVNHDEHHLIWFGLLLAVSPAGDALGVDAALHAWRGWRAPELSPAYGLPIRLVWILFGVIYFFPGFWKVWHCGWHWGLGNNLRYHLYAKWFELGGWLPFFRIDLHPPLLKTAGVATPLFELGFLFFILFRRTRFVAVLGGLAFHSSTYLFMRINFWPLLGLYPIFFDWQRILAALGRWLFPIPLPVAASGAWQRLLAVMAIFDVLGRVTYLETGDEESLRKLGLTGGRRIVCRAPDGIRTGAAAFQLLVKRVPLLWPAYPLLWLLASRVDRAEAREAPPPSFLSRGYSLSILVGGVLIVINSAYGECFRKRGGRSPATQASHTRSHARKSPDARWKRTRRPVQRDRSRKNCFVGL